MPIQRGVRYILTGFVDWRPRRAGDVDHLRPALEALGEWPRERSDNFLGRVYMRHNLITLATRSGLLGAALIEAMASGSVEVFHGFAFWKLQSMLRNGHLHAQRMVANATDPALLSVCRRSISTK